MVTEVLGSPLVGVNPVMVGIVISSFFVHDCKKKKTASIGMASSLNFFMVSKINLMVENFETNVPLSHYARVYQVLLNRLLYSVSLTPTLKY
jgi:hypothetical protein